MIAKRANDGVALRAALANDALVPAQVHCNLLLEHWHDLHEDIVFVLGLLGDPAAVHTIRNAAAKGCPDGQGKRRIRTCLGRKSPLREVVIKLAIVVASPHRHPSKRGLHGPRYQVR